MKMPEVQIDRNHETAAQPTKTMKQTNGETQREIDSWSTGMCKLPKWPFVSTAAYCKRKESYQDGDQQRLEANEK